MLVVVGVKGQSIAGTPGQKLGGCCTRPSETNRGPEPGREGRARGCQKRNRQFLDLGWVT